MVLGIASPGALTGDTIHARQTSAGVRRHTVGWEYVHIAIDDCTRLAYAEVLGDEKALSVVAFLRRAVEFFARHGIAVQQLLTDNGGGYRSMVHAIACHTLGVKSPAHARLPATDQRQGRALHPHHARRLGLRRDLSLKQRAHRST